MWHRPLLFSPGAACALAMLGLLLAGPGALAQRTIPLHVAYDRIDVSIDGSIFLLSTGRCTLTRILPDGSAPTTIGGPGWQGGQFDAPADLWARNGVDIMVADENNHRIQRFDRSLAFVAELSTRDDSYPERRFGYPRGVALSRQGDLFLSDGENVRALKVTGFKNVERAFGTFGGGKGKLAAPTEVEVGPDDNVYVLDAGRIVLFDSFGNFLRALPESLFTRPSAITSDDRGTLVFDDTVFHYIDRSGTIAGRIGLSAILPGADSPPRDIALAPGKLYLLLRDGIAVCPDPRDNFLESHRKSE